MAQQTEVEVDVLVDEQLLVPATDRPGRGGSVHPERCVISLLHVGRDVIDGIAHPEWARQSQRDGSPDRCARHTDSLATHPGECRVLPQMTHTDFDILGIDRRMTVQTHRELPTGPCQPDVEPGRDSSSRVVEQFDPRVARTDRQDPGPSGVAGTSVDDQDLHGGVRLG